MKNAPNLELSLLARQWGATAVPFGELSAEAWLETPQNQRALLLAGPNGHAAQRHAPGRSQWRGQVRPGGPLAPASGPALVLPAAFDSRQLERLRLALGPGRQTRQNEPTFRREANLALIEAALAELGQVVPLIVLDEAQSFGYGSLEEVRLLLGLNLADPPAFGLVLIGDEYLLGTLRLRQHRSLFSRIACHFSLGLWTAPLVSQYVQQNLAAVGITRQAIEPAALNLLTSASSGLARSLCLLGRAAWIEAASAGAQTIEPPHVQAAIERVPGAAGLVAPPLAQTTA